MTSKKNKARAPKELNPKKFKKKTSVLLTEKVEFVDYKDVNLLNRFVSDRSKIRNRRVTGNDVQQQRDIALAIKNAREMALVPYAKRVSQTRTGRPPRDGDGRRERPDRDAVNERPSDAAGGDTGVDNTGLEDTGLEDTGLEDTALDDGADDAVEVEA